MLNNGGFSQPCNSQNFLANASFGASLPTHFVKKARFFLVPKSSSVHTLRCRIGSFSTNSLQFPQNHLVFCASIEERRSGFRVFSQKKRGKGSSGEVEEEDFGDEEEDFEDDEEGFEDFEEEDDEDVGELLPDNEMEKWLEKKPSGFGEGKAYDTKVEAKLLQEPKKNKKAPAADVRKVKINPVKPNSKKGDSKKKEPQVVPAGIQVRVGNLPKKKNIHRDLQVAFKGVPGIINITPVVSGNEKTRDPVCKGYGFIDFKSEKDASRFIETFSKQTIAFGKVQKQVKYEMMKSPSSKGTLENSSDVSNFTPLQRLPILDKTQNTSIKVDISSWEKTSNEWNKPGDKLVAERVEDIEDGNLILEDAKNYHIEPRAKSTATHPSPSKQLVKLKGAEERLKANGREEKAPEVEDIGDNLSPGDGVETSAEREQRIELLEQSLFARFEGGELQELESSGSPKRQEEESMENKKQPKPKAKGGKAPKFKSPPSAKRVKMREKVVMSEVFTKYGSQKGALASKGKR